MFWLGQWLSRACVLEWVFSPHASLLCQAHTVRVGFWPLDFPELPKGDALTAITAQNVFAHVPQPVDFLKGCAKAIEVKHRPCHGFIGQFLRVHRDDRHPGRDPENHSGS